MRVLESVISKFKVRMIAAGALATLLLTITLVSRGHSSAEAPQDCPGVSICNTEARPIPVRGAVQVTNVDGQPIPVQGAVQIANRDGQPIPISGAVDVRNPVTVQTLPRQPMHVVFVPIASENLFYAQGTVGLRPGDNSVLFSPPGFEVPAGKVLRLQHVSADIDMGSPFQVPQVGLKLHPQQSTPFPLAEVQKGLSPQWSINQALPPLPVPPGFQIEIFFQRTGGSNPLGQAALTLALTGELQDAP